MTSPLSWCTCACESASAPSQYQQAVFHRSVWQKPARLEQNPPKTTTLSRGIIHSPNIRGKQEDTASSIIQQESTLKKNTGTRCAAIVQHRWQRKNRMCWLPCLRWLVNHCTTSPETCDAIGAISNCCYTYSQRSSPFCLLLHLESDTNKKKLAVLSLRWGLKLSSE